MCFSRLRTIKWSARLKWPPIVLLKLKGGFFELIKNSKFFSPEVWPEVGRKYKDLFSWPNKYELRQHAHAISFCPVLTVHSRKWVFFNRQNGRIYYTKKRTQLLNNYLPDHPHWIQPNLFHHDTIMPKL